MGRGLSTTIYISSSSTFCGIWYIFCFMISYHSFDNLLFSGLLIYLAKIIFILNYAFMVETMLKFIERIIIRPLSHTLSTYLLFEL